ncbi:MAG: hypothetical protein ABSD81_02040 [Methanomicrobiales archaeon]|jgi:hypothetical protein
MPLTRRDLAIAVAALVVLAGPIIAFSLLEKTGQDSGYLEGTVTIGPLCPVEPCQVSPDVLAEAYEARKIVVTAVGSPLPGKVLDLDTTGSFVTSLAPGTYTVDINRIGIDRSPDVPKTVEIRPGEQVRLEIHIDTGLR